MHLPAPQNKKPLAFPEKKSEMTSLVKAEAWFWEQFITLSFDEKGISSIYIMQSLNITVEVHYLVYYLFIIEITNLIKLLSMHRLSWIVHTMYR